LLKIKISGGGFWVFQKHQKEAETVNDEKRKVKNKKRKLK